MLLVDPRMVPFKLKQYTKDGTIHLETAVSVQDFDTIPRIDAEPVRTGLWMVAHDGAVLCSACGAKILGNAEQTRERFNYCPHCGAKMRG